MLDWQGNLVEPHHRQRVILDELPDDHVMVSTAEICHVEQTRVDLLNVFIIFY